AFLIVNDAMVKFVSDDLPVGEIIFIRGLMATVLMTFAAGLRGELEAWPTLLQRSVMLRTFGEVMGTLFYLTALTLMAIGTVTTILQIVPLVSTAASALFLREKVGLRRWAAAITGFLGVLLIIQPGTSGFHYGALLVIAAVFFVALRDISTRAMPANVPSFLITAYTAAVVALAGFGLGFSETWIAVSFFNLLLLALASVCILGGYYFVILSMRVGEVSVVAPFRYSIVIWALLIGYFIWNEVPDQLTFAGIAIVIGAGVYTFQREAKLMRSQRLQKRHGFTE
ncbi:MAG: DMT family transporter, partial [Fimbriimonadaceae bacterium]|nr:DMT family transporter [Alphaproteobacteria bacterium]